MIESVEIASVAMALPESIVTAAGIIALAYLMGKMLDRL